MNADRPAGGTARGYFVTGTDTGIGKTWAAAGLLIALRRRGLRAAGMKPVASGCEATADGLRNADALRLMQCASRDWPYALVNPYALAEPIAPHVAAADAGLRIDVGRIRASFQRLAAEADRVVVEGVGGWLVPLNAQDDVADLARSLDLPVILVVGLRLGCLNHALLSAAAIAASGARLAGWIANTPEASMPRITDNVAALRARLTAPLLGTIPHLERFDPELIADRIELPANH